MPEGGWLRFYMTWILPLIILVVYLKGYYDFFVNQGTVILVSWMIFAVVLLAVILAVAFRSEKKTA